MAEYVRHRPHPATCGLRHLVRTCGHPDGQHVAPELVRNEARVRAHRVRGKGGAGSERHGAVAATRVAAQGDAAIIKPHLGKCKHIQVETCKCVGSSIHHSARYCRWHEGRIVLHVQQIHRLTLLGQLQWCKRTRGRPRTY